MDVFLAILLIVSALFLIFLILIQRGKGGGLAGAFGGLGGQSAFGTKAGDKIMWFTVYVSAFWIVLCVVSVRLMSAHADMMAGPGFDDVKPTPNGTLTPTPGKGDSKATDAKTDDAGKGSDAATAPATSAPATDAPASSTPAATAPAEAPASAPAATDSKGEAAK